MNHPSNHDKLRVVLDCGLDESSIHVDDFQIVKNAMRIIVPWEFGIGTCLALKLATDEGYVKDIEVMVADCCRISSQRPLFSVTLLFLKDCETTTSAKKALAVQASLN